ALAGPARGAGPTAGTRAQPLHVHDHRLGAARRTARRLARRDRRHAARVRRLGSRMPGGLGRRRARARRPRGDSQPAHRKRCHHAGMEQRVLVVDDEPSIVDAVATALRYEGYLVEEALTGGDALAAADRFEPDLIVLDW